MFEVHAEYEIDERWEKTDGLILKAAGKGGGALAVATGCQYRTIIFTVETFAEASALRKRVSLVAGVKATLREV